MNKRTQGGSLVSFIVVGVLLAIVLVGGLYGLNKYNAQRSSGDIASDEGTSAGTTDKKAGYDNSNKDTKTDTSKSGTTSTKPTTSPTTSSPAPASSSNSTNSGSNLPQTGPADTLYQMSVLAAIVAAGAYYVRSRA